MPEYAITMHFGAPDDEHARRKGEHIADLTAAEYGIRNPVITRVDGGLRDQLVEALTREHYHRAHERVEASPEEHSAAMADAALAVVAPRLCTAVCADVERERDELAAEVERLRDTARAHRNDATRQRARAESAVAEVERLRTEVETAYRQREEAREARGHQLGRAEQFKAERDAARAEARKLRKELAATEEAVQARGAEYRECKHKLDNLTRWAYDVDTKRMEAERDRDDARRELGDWRAAAQGWEERAERVTAERDDAIELVRFLAYRDECRQFDHHGWCQTHGWLRDGGCPHARAQELLAALDAEETTDDQ
jgi:hypothetical protein